MDRDTLDPLDVHFGKRLRAARTKRGISQTDLAGRENLAYQQIQKYESGGNRISASRLVHLAASLEVPVAWFFEGLPAKLSMPRKTEVKAKRGRSKSK